MTTPTVRYADALNSIPADAAPLVFPVGKTAAGTLQLIDLAQAPHALLAGTTGSGKSVGLNVAITAMLQRSEAEFVLIDPKRVELAPYRGVKRVRAVVTDMDAAVDHLTALVAEMEERYEAFMQAGVRKLEHYNEQTGKNMPEIVLVVDELSDLMDTHSKAVLPDLVRLAQLGRAAGIHMLLATQRPAADTIPKKLLGNIPTRIGYRTQSHVESRLILGESGAEGLHGNGDLLARVPTEATLIRAQGPYISDEEVAEVCAELADTTMQDVVDGSDDEPEADDEPVAEADPIEATPADDMIAEAVERALSGITAEQARLQQALADADADKAELNAALTAERKRTAELELAVMSADQRATTAENDRDELVSQAATTREQAESAIGELHAAEGGLWWAWLVVFICAPLGAWLFHPSAAAIIIAVASVGSTTRLRAAQRYVQVICKNLGAKPANDKENANARMRR